MLKAVFSNPGVRSFNLSQAANAERQLRDTSLHALFASSIINFFVAPSQALITPPARKANVYCGLRALFWILMPVRTFVRGSFHRPMQAWYYRTAFNNISACTCLQLGVNIGVHMPSERGGGRASECVRLLDIYVMRRADTPVVVTLPSRIFGSYIYLTRPYSQKAKRPDRPGSFSTPA